MATGTVTFMKGCGQSNPTVELSKPYYDPDTNVKNIKVSVKLTSQSRGIRCLALPSEHTLDFTFDTFDGPVQLTHSRGPVVILDPEEPKEPKVKKIDVDRRVQGLLFKDQHHV